MPVSTNKILVKVGKSSNLKFRGAQAFRAVTLNELFKLTDMNPDASIAIIENIKPSDNDKVKEFIKAFEAKSANNRVFFYVADNEDNTCGIADELAYDIYLTAEDLYRAIKVNCGITVDIDLSKSTEINVSEDDMFDNQFDDAWSNIPADNKDSGIYELPGVESKDDFEDFDSSIMDEDEADNQEKLVDDKEAEIKAPETIEVTGAISADTDEKIKELKLKVEKITAEANSAKENADKLREELHMSLSKNGELTKLVKSLEGERDIFRDKLLVFETTEVMEDPITLSEYKELQDTIASLQDKVKELSKANIGAISNEQVEELSRLLEEANAANDKSRDQLDDYRKRLRESGSRLTNAQSKLAQYEQEISELNDKITEIDELRIKVAQIDNYKAKAKEADSLKSKIAELEAKLKIASEGSIELNEARADAAVSKQTISGLQKKIDGLNNDLESARSELRNSIAEKTAIENKVTAVYNMYYAVVSLLGISVDKLGEARESSESNDDIIRSLDTTIEALNKAKEESESKIATYEARIRELSDVESTLASKDEEIKTLTELKDSNRQTIETLREKIREMEYSNNELSKQVDDADKRVDIARNFANNEKIELKKKLDDTQKQLRIVQGQLSDKEKQYKQLVESSGMSEGGASALLENSKAIEAINKTLREQVVSLKSELEDAKAAKVKAEMSAMALEESNKSMRLSMQSMNELMGGGAASNQNTVRAIRYNSRGTIIPVFGSGSFGVTTTAMSLAHKLSAQSKVLYIDFDMISSRADEWFRTNPLVKGIPGLESGGNKNTGLGILVEKQFRFFIENVHSIINKPVTTKAGCIDYLSGFMQKPDVNKLCATDFGALLDYCGSNYAYVIIDFGILGASDIGDQLIKAFSDAAYRNVVVTTNDMFTITKFRFKLNENKINIQKIGWLINMCNSTRLDDKSKKVIAPARYGMMQFSPEFYGKKLNFTQDPLLRDKFSLFVDQELFHK